MKKNLMLVLVAIFMMIPLTSFAKTALSDSELGTITGNEGVSINFTSMDFGIQISNIAWGDLQKPGIPIRSKIKFLPPILTTFFKAKPCKSLPSNPSSFSKSSEGTAYMKALSVSPSGSLIIFAH
jgi:hypothetical protein